MVGFNPVTYDVQEGGSVGLVITRDLDSQVPVEVTLTTSGVTATGLLALDMHTYLLTNILFRRC